MKIETLALLAGAAGVAYLVVKQRQKDAATAASTMAVSRTVPEGAVPSTVVIIEDDEPGYGYGYGYPYPAWGWGWGGGRRRHHGHGHGRRGGGWGGGGGRGRGGGGRGGRR